MFDNELCLLVDLYEKLCYNLFFMKGCFFHAYKQDDQIINVRIKGEESV